MKKLVIKTALLTLATILMVAVITFFALFLFSPKTLGNVSNGFGNYSAAVYFYEKQYNKTGNVEDLAVLVDVLDENSDCAKTQEYAEKLVFHNDFITFCQKEDKNVGMTTAEFYYSKLAVSTYYNVGVVAAADSCRNSVEAIGYTDFNAFRVLNATVNLTDAEKTTVKETITELKSGLSGDALSFAERDIKELFTL